MLHPDVLDVDQDRDGADLVDLRVRVIWRVRSCMLTVSLCDAS